MPPDEPRAVNGSADRPPAAAPIEGVCERAFAAVEAAFRENFDARDEIGAGLCVLQGGRPVVDLWGGHADAARRIPWRRDTLVNAYSVGKGITAMFALSLVERGLLSLDRPVAELWPEFAAHDKGATTLRMLLAHQAGLPGIRRPLAPDAIYDWPTMTRALAEQAPYWAPGSALGYHVNTYGFLVGEPIVRRLGSSFGALLRERITGPLDADFHSGLPTPLHARVATLVQPEPAPPTGDDPRGSHDLAPADPGPIASPRPRVASLPASLATGDPETDRMLLATYFNPPGLSGHGTVNTAAWRSASIPSTNSHATARAVATLYDAFLRRDVAHGGLVGPGLRAEARETCSDGPDRVLGKPSRFGLGFQLSQATRRIGGGGDCFGHFGYGGSLGFADPDAELAFAYLTNRPGDRWHNPRTVSLVEAVYAALGRPLAPVASREPDA